MEELHKRMQVVTGAFTDEATVPADRNADTNYQTAPYMTQMAENVDEITMNHEQPRLRILLKVLHRIKAVVLIQGSG